MASKAASWPLAASSASRSSLCRRSSDAPAKRAGWRNEGGLIGSLTKSFDDASMLVGLAAHAARPETGSRAAPRWDLRVLLEEHDLLPGGVAALQRQLGRGNCGAGNQRVGAAAGAVTVVVVIVAVVIGRGRHRRGRGRGR